MFPLPTLDSEMTYTAGIIGAGRIGMAYDASHASAYEAVPGIEIDCIADIDEGVLGEYGDKWDIPDAKRFRDHENMLTNCDLDVVSIATPAQFHHQHVMEVLESPADIGAIWCEKPISTNVSDAKEMVNACNSAGVELVINHQLRFASPFQELRSAIIDDGILGEVTSIVAQVSEGESLLRNLTHQLDLMFALTGDRLGGQTKQISCFGTAADDHDTFAGDMGGRVMCLQDNGKTIYIDHCCGYNVDGGSGTDTLHLTGTEGKLSLGTWRFPKDFYRYRDRQGDGHFCDYSEPSLPNVDNALPDIEFLKTTHPHIGSRQDTRLDPDITAFLQESMMNVVNHITSLLNGERNTEHTAEDAVLALEIIIGSFISHRTSAHVSLPLQPPLGDVGKENLTG